jgi:hypothetical protein
MKLHEYIAQLKKLIADNPETANFDVIYSGDDEGNYYNQVYFSPTLGNYADGEFTDELEEDMKNNAVCIN